MWLISSWLFAFMLFNFQGPALYSLWWISHRSELVYYITLFSACQALFSKFFNFFLKPKFQSKSLVFGLLMSFLSSRASLSRWQLIYNIMPKLFCQHLFWKKSRFFSKKWEIPTFPLNHAGFWLILSLKSMQNCCKIPFNIEMIFCVIKN
mgnify:CR=1 FL=1